MPAHATSLLKGMHGTGMQMVCLSQAVCRAHSPETGTVELVQPLHLHRCMSSRVQRDRQKSLVQELRGTSLRGHDQNNCCSMKDSFLRSLHLLCWSGTSCCCCSMQNFYWEMWSLAYPWSSPSHLFLFYSILPLPSALGSCLLWYPELCLGRKTAPPASNQVACGARRWLFFVLHDKYLVRSVQLVQNVAASNVPNFAYSRFLSQPDMGIGSWCHWEWIGAQ